ncbi:ketopantoate reductase family protein [Rhizobium mayense]|uniref:2-dehydropantoate 2-reductase n=1 Tax=Rhizobium mayense TaxID=1312184 RepID=A0ABT7K4X5_9HYPH|nr:2-dehydropantoate 2-reductase [Rhizobium mayense]MDL2403657.1 2-dehydropantoate 2-reductase [Rhizobium mayense]
MSHFKQTDNYKISVAGAGAIGVTLAARLLIGGYRVSLIARGANLAAIQKDGIRLLDNEGDHRLKIDAGTPSDYPVQDLVFLCPKSQDLPALAAAVQPLIGPNTMIVPVINGIPWWYFDGRDGRWNGPQIGSVDPDGALKELLPSPQIIGTTTLITAERIQPGVVKTFNPLQMTIGELDGRVSDRVERLGAILQQAGIATRVTQHIRDSVWTKVVRNLVSNPVTAITGASLRENFSDNNLAAISEQMLHEVLPVIAAYGARLEIDPETIMTAGRSMGDVKTSMLQDLERGSPLELASICDAVIELADAHGISMPVTQAITALARYKSLSGNQAQAA